MKFIRLDQFGSDVSISVNAAHITHVVQARNAASIYLVSGEVVDVYQDVASILRLIEEAPQINPRFIGLECRAKLDIHVNTCQITHVAPDVASSQSTAVHLVSGTDLLVPVRTPGDDGGQAGVDEVVRRIME